ncbi:DDT domain-containing protein [Cynara cardunculus var. scolymus]|uniref:DDT domain-containing protein n=1 Tax=Cynara cardunculus var. scolymus TaxID=59895 RepID=A0A118K3P7_CYNCS|nr:DDT domain-containing protein [Cynara cardunculus var. scolymus]
MSNKRAPGKQQIPRKKCNERNIKVAANSTVSKKRKQPQHLNSESSLRLQDDLLSPDFILRKVFRKDGPPLGVEFDNLPSHAFRFCNVKGISHRPCQEKQRALKRQKTSKPTNVEDQIIAPDSAPVKHGRGKGLMTVWRLTNEESNAVKKHGIGKGLMTIRQLTNPGAGNLPTCDDNDHGACSQFPASTSQKPPAQGKKKSRRQQPVPRRLANKLLDKKSLARSKKVRCEQVGKEKQLQREICEIALVGGRSEEDLIQYSMLVDDEELELRELHEVSNSQACCAHCSANRLHGCSLCKDLLAKFPPDSVRMKQPLHMQPWDSSPQLVKKLFKIFHFISTYAVIIGIESFTLDELAQAFIDKDSVLLGKLNLSLLELLLTGVEKELGSGFVSHMSKNWKYRGLLQSVEHQDSVLKLWKRSLNSLTWVEILRQVLVAAGFGSKRDTTTKEPVDKEAALMGSYGLSPGTLKGELFTILLLQGNSGMKISELATCSSIVGLKLATTTVEVEQLISSMLSSDITLFEKLSPSSYRLRSNSIIKDSDDDQSDLEDSGSVDDDPNDISNYNNMDDLDDGSGPSIASKHGQKNLIESKDSMLTVNSEIDESHPGEMWLLGLMEGEFSDLNIEEKLNALLALVDLLRAGSSTRMKEPVRSAVQSIPNVCHIGSGAKIKRSTAKQQRMFMPLENNCSQMINSGESDTIQDIQTVDSAAIISVIQEKSCSSGQKNAREIEVVHDLHPMQSLFLGSDRRYNRYWLFLGPCNMCDPGHKRIYFESSEDGHWEVIETEEALANLLSALDRRGRRESRLLFSLEKRNALLCEAMSSMPNDARSGQPALSCESERSVSRDDSSSAVSDVDNLLGLNYVHHDNLASTSAVVTSIGNREQAKQKWCRLQQYDAWLWNSFHSTLNVVKHGKRSFFDSLTRCERCHDLFWRDEKHCRICHTTFELDFDLEERYAIHAATCRDDSAPDMFPKHKILSSQLQSLKAAAYTLESSMPEGAMVGAWTKSTHNVWVKRLRRTATLAELLQVLADFVGAINKGWSYQSDTALGFDYDLDDIVASFTSMPQTSSAVALWLVKLDCLIAPHIKKVGLQKTTGVSSRSTSKGKDALVQ